MDSIDYHWKIHPVIRIDLSKAGKAYGDDLKAFLIEQLRIIAEQYGIPFSAEIPLSFCFERLIRDMAQTDKVVILIDEYDKPIIEYLTEPEKARINREILKDFYGMIKASDEYLQFVFLTGVSKFSKVGVFSGLNNLQDLTTDAKYAAMLGYTQEELEENFKPHIEELAKAEQLTVQETLEKIKHWYNGYRFSEATVKVYNPFSTLLLFAQQRFKAHWFETGTPTFLVKLLENASIPIEELDHYHVSEMGFSSYEIENLNAIALLFQTGYMTIRNYDPSIRQYELSYPNFEVKSSLQEVILGGFSHVTPGSETSHLYKLTQSIQSHNLELFFDTLKVFFANIPYTIQLSNEKYYQSIFYMIFTLLGMRIHAEVSTNKGRIDAVIETKDRIYLFEFKLQGKAEEALEQIQKKEYGQKYTQIGKSIWYLGVEFDPTERNIGRWINSKHI